MIRGALGAILPPGEVVMEHRKVVDEREARVLLARAARAGGDIGAMARAHGIDGRSLNAWRMNLERGGTSPSKVQRGPGARRARAAQLVELIPTPHGGSSPPSNGSRYTLRVAGVVLEFDDDVRGDTLRRVLEVLRSC